MVLIYRPRCCFGFLLAETSPPTLIVTAQTVRREEETDIVPLPTEMVGGRIYWLSCLLTCSAVLLLGVSLPDVEASSCHQRIIHKRVGDTVELLPCLSPYKSHQLTVARWKQGETEVADKDSPGSDNSNRFYLNPTNLSLTVKKLTLQDSGEFSFVSEVKEHQLITVCITLQVHEPITQQPHLQVNSTWNDLNQSCSVFLECSSVYNRNVNYSLSVRDQTHSDSRLQLNIRPEDGKNTFTCRISDFVSEMSASKTLMCSNSTGPPEPDDRLSTLSEYLVFVLGAAVGGCALIVIIVGTAVGVRCCKRKAANMESNDLTVYADVTDIVSENGSSTMKPCSVYETIDNRTQPVTSVTSGPQTVYDQIQLSRLRKTSSPYQEI